VIKATENALGRLTGIISASLHRSKDGMRVVNYAQWKSSEDWKNLVQMSTPGWFREMVKYAEPTHISMRFATNSTKPAQQTDERVYKRIKHREVTAQATVSDRLIGAQSSSGVSA